MLIQMCNNLRSSGLPCPWALLFSSLLVFLPPLLLLPVRRPLSVPALLCLGSASLAAGSASSQSLSRVQFLKILPEESPPPDISSFILICVFICFPRVLFVVVAMCTHDHVMAFICFCQREKSILLAGTSKKTLPSQTLLTEADQLMVSDSEAALDDPSYRPLTTLASYSCAKKQ